MVLNILDSYNTALILATEIFSIQHKKKNSSVKLGSIFNLKFYLKFIRMIMVLMIVIIIMTMWDGVFLSFLSLFQITILNLHIMADIELRGSGFYLCSQDYGTLCFLPSDRDTQIPHGRLLSTAWSSAECHWHRSPNNRSKSSTPATVRPLRHQPQPNKHGPSGGKKRADRNGRRYSDHYSLPD